MFGVQFEHVAAVLSVGRVATIILVASGLTLLIHGTYYRVRNQQVIGGLIALLPSTFHLSLATMFALTISAESLEILAYMPLAHLERWLETQDVITNTLKFLGYLAVGTGIWGLWHLHFSEEQRLKLLDCLLLSFVGFIFIYFIQISHIVSRLVHVLKAV